MTTKRPIDSLLNEYENQKEYFKNFRHYLRFKYNSYYNYRKYVLKSDKILPFYGWFLFYKD